MNKRMYTDWRTADLYTMQGLRTIDRAIAERIGYVVSGGDHPYITRNGCRNGVNVTERIPLPKYWQETVYPWDAFQPSLEESGFLLWHKLQGESQTGVIGKKEPFECYEYTIGSELPQGLPCCLVWLQWWDMRHVSENAITEPSGDHWLLSLARKQDIREQIRPYRDEAQP